MQIDFFMGPEDEEQFLHYIFSRDGYCSPQYSASYPPQLVTNDIPFTVDDRATPLRELMIFKEDIYSKADAVSEYWKQYWEPGDQYITRVRPGFEFTRAMSERDKLYPGRLFFIATAASFIPQNAYKDYSDITEAHRDGLQELENFYKSCCNYIRKRFEKIDGWYHAPNVKSYCSENGLKFAAASH